jgi:DNA-directed RNA polymerase subunit RPC12/RpoP
MFTQVRSYDNYIPANIVLSRLEQEGIKAYLQDEHTVTIDPIISNAIGGIKLMVLSDQLDRAMHLINEFEDAYNKAGACPKCGSTNVRFLVEPETGRNWLKSIFDKFRGIYGTGSKGIYHCYKCGHEFSELQFSALDESTQ